MLCPQCDGVLNAAGCQACGWKPGDAHTRNEYVFPFKSGAVYPHTPVAAALPHTVAPKPASEPSLLPPHAPAVEEMHQSLAAIGVPSVLASAMAPKLAERIPDPAEGTPEPAAPLQPLARPRRGKSSTVVQ